MSDQQQSGDPLVCKCGANARKDPTGFVLHYQNQPTRPVTDIEVGPTPDAISHAPSPNAVCSVNPIPKLGSWRLQWT